jgi:hypothetical protein
MGGGLRYPVLACAASAKYLSGANPESAAEKGEAQEIGMQIGMACKNKNKI